MNAQNYIKKKSPSPKYRFWNTTSCKKNVILKIQMLLYSNFFLKTSQEIDYFH